MTKLSDEVRWLEDKSDQLTRDLAQLRAELNDERAKVLGNVLFVRDDGFERPYTLCPTYAPYEATGRVFPLFFEMFEYERPNLQWTGTPSCPRAKKIGFSLTDKKDPFGRVIYEEV